MNQVDNPFIQHQPLGLIYIERLKFVQFQRKDYLKA